LISVLTTVKNNTKQHLCLVLNWIFHILLLKVSFFIIEHLTVTMRLTFSNVNFEMQTRIDDDVSS